MDQKKLYNDVAKRHVLPSHKLRNAIVAFISGGILAIASQGVFDYCFEVLEMSKENSSSLVIIIIILFTSFLTGLGIYDSIAQFCGAGLFIPISGFANALASSALEHKSEGLIYGIGSNMFKLAGSVIVYGIVSVYLFGILRLLFNL